MKILRKGLKLFGYKLIKTGNFNISKTPQRTKLDILKHIQTLGFYPKTIVDIGVAYGTPELTEVFSDSYFIWVEPVKEFEIHLKKLTSQYKGEYHLKAVGSKDGIITLNVHDDLYGSSLLNESDGVIFDGEPREVEISKLDNLILNSCRSGNALIKIDVQGAELEVLEGASYLLKKCEIVILEVSFYRFLKTNPVFSEVVIYMKEKGFEVFDICDFSYRPLDGNLGQVDVFFVKEESQFWKHHNWERV